MSETSDHVQLILPPPLIFLGHLHFDHAGGLCDFPGCEVHVHRGEIDASNLYITRTDLHELLAQAFDAAGHRDSAAAHYKAVLTAWRRADPVYQGRRARAAEWLSRYLGPHGRP